MINKNFSSAKTVKKIAIGSDHGGFSLKTSLKTWLENNHFQVMDLGTFTEETKSDYPFYGEKVAKLVNDGLVDYGILVCFSGTGMAIVANRYPKVRALNCYSYHPPIVRLAREHNDINLLAFSNHFLTSFQAIKLLKIFFSTDFLNIPRYKKRLLMLEKKILKIS